jgi:hypothetical protein
MHIPEASAACQLPGIISQQFRAVTERMGITISISKSTVMLFTKASRHILKPRTVQLFVEPIHWVNTAHNLALTLDTWLTWSPHIDQVRKKAAQ